jgi:hypothetical protein
MIAPVARIRRRRIGAIVLALLFGMLAMDSAFANKKTRNTLIGVGIGAAGGALLSNGDTWGTLGGAAAGGLIGNVLTHDRHHDRRGRDRDYRRGRDRDRYYDHRHRR